MQATLNRIRATSTRPRLPYHVPVAIVRGFVRALVLFPVAIRLEWLRWLLRDMGPLHPCANEVLGEISDLELARKRGAIAAARICAAQIGRQAARWC